MKFTSILFYLALAAATAAAPLAETSTGLALAEAGSISARGTNANEALEKRNNCILHVKYDSNWDEWAFRRYRVKAWVGTGGLRNNGNEMLQEYEYYLEKHSFEVSGSQNFVTWREDDGWVVFADFSFWEGKEGHDRYLDFYQEVLNNWRSWSNGCDVDSHL